MYLLPGRSKVDDYGTNSDEARLTPYGGIAFVHIPARSSSSCARRRSMARSAADRLRGFSTAAADGDAEIARKKSDSQRLVV